MREVHSRFILLSERLQQKYGQQLMIRASGKNESKSTISACFFCSYENFRLQNLQLRENLSMNLQNLAAALYLIAVWMTHG
jgi:hypothetical protein